MSRSVDQRIVDMQFNNSQFESGVKATISWLDKLTGSLSNMDSGSGLDKLKMSFSGLDVIAATVISNITSAVMDLGSKLIGYVVDPFEKAMNQIVTGGLQRAKNLENANFLLSGLFKGDEAKVKEVLDNALTAVKGTAYGLDEAAKAAAQFAASGIKEGEDMVRVLQGVAGVAALTSSEFSDISRIFTNVAGTGRVTRNELNQLAMRGINPFILIAEHMGVTVQEVQDILRDPKATLSAEVFFGTFSQFAEHATKANETYAGSLSNVKSALSRIGAKVATPYLEQMKGVFNALMPVVDKFNEQLDPLINFINKLIEKSAQFAIKFLNNMDLSKLSGKLKDALKIITNLGQSVINIGRGIGSVLKPIREAFETIFPKPTAKQLITFTNGLVSLTSKFKLSSKEAEKLRLIFKELFGTVKNLLDVVISVGNGIWSVVKPIGDAFVTIFPPLSIAKTLNTISQSLSNMASKLKLNTDESNNLRRIFEGLFTDVIDLFNDVKSVVMIAWSYISPVFEGLIKSFENIVQIVRNLYKGAKSIIKPIAEAFQNIFPPTTADKLVSFTKGLADLTSKFKLSERSADNLRRIFEGLFSAVDIVWGVFKSVVKVAWELINALSPLGRIILELLAPIGDLIKKFRDWSKETYFFKNMMGLLKSVLDDLKKFLNWVADGIAKGIDKIKSKFGSFGKKDAEPLKIFTEEVEIAFRPFTWIANAFKKAWEIIVKIWEWAWPKIEPIVNKAKEILSQFFKGLKDAFQSGDLNKLATLFTTGALGVFVVTLTNFTNNLKDGIKNIVKTFKEGGGIKDFLDGLSNTFKEWTKGDIKVKMIKAIAQAILMLAIGLLILSTIPSEKLIPALAAITTLFGELAAMMMIMVKQLGKLKEGIKIAAISSMLLVMAASVLILSMALKKIAKLDSGQVLMATTAISILVALLVGTAKMLSDGESKMMKGTAGLVALALGVFILSMALKKISKLDPENVFGAVIAIGILIGALVASAKILSSNEKKTMAGTAGMIAMAVAVYILSMALKKIAKLDPNAVEAAVMAIVVLIAALGIAAYALSNSEGKTMAASAGLIAMAAAVFILSMALKKIAKLEPNAVVVAVGAILAMIAGLVIAANLLQGSISGAAAMLIMAAAILILTPAIKAFGKMPLADIGKALLVLVGIFAVFGVAALVLGPVTPIILALGAAMALLGVGVLALGAGLSLLAVGMTAMAGAGVLGVMALKNTLLMMISLIPELATKLAQGFLNFINVIADGMPVIMKLIRNIVVGLIEVLTELAPQLMEAGFTFLILFLKGISENIQEIVALGLLILTELIKGITSALPDLAKAAVDLIITFARVLGEEVPRLVDAGFKMIIDLCHGLAKAIDENAYELGYAAADLGIAIVKGIIKGIGGFGTRIGEEMTKLGKAMWTAFKSFFGIKSPSKLMEGEGGNVVLGIIKGLAGGIFDLHKKAMELGGKIFDGIKGAVSKVGDIASNVVNTLGDGLKNGLSKIGDAAKNIGNSVLGGIKGVLGIQSPAKTMIDTANQVGAGLILGFKDIMRPVSNAAGKVGSGVLDVMKDSLSKVGEALEADMGDFNPIITPVVDMSLVEQGLAHTFNDPKNLDIGLMKDQTAKIAAANQNGSNLGISPNGAGSDAKVASAITSLETNMRNLIDKVGHLQIFLDNGALVGGIASDMDKALGGRVTLAGRRVI